VKTLIPVFCFVAAATAGSARFNLFSGVDAALENPASGNGFFGARLMARKVFGRGVSLEGAWEGSAIAGGFPGLDRWSPYRAWDFTPVLLNDSLKILGNLDRLLLTARMKAANLILGRQAVSWGLGKTFSPSDFVAPIPLYAIDREFRTGVDAARLRVPLGTMEELDLGFLAGDGLHGDGNGFWARAALSAAGLDVTPMAAYYRRCATASLGVNGVFAGASWWAEGAFTDADGTRYATITAGADHRLGANGYGWLEYTYNGAGAHGPEDYPDLRGSKPYTLAGAYLQGKNYLNPGVALSPHPLWNLQGTVTCNLSDQSAGFSLNAEFRPADNTLLKAGCLFGAGSEDTEMGPQNRGYLEMRFFL
jgi:hypothetical protein